jgi:hypothetical protein
MLQLETFLEVELEFRPCFICITESWLRPFEETSIKLHGYQVVTNCSRSISRGGGCIIFARDDISKSCQICDVKRYYKEKIFEVCCISMQLENIPKLYVSTVYRSPGTDVKSFLTQLDSYLCDNKNYCSILCGDFNIDLKSQTNTAKDFLQTLLEHNMRPTIENYTRITETSQSLVDNIFTDLYGNYNSQVIPCSFSDHDAQTVSFPDQLIQPIKRIRVQMKRKYSQVALENFKYDLKTVSWNDLFKEETCEGKISLFYSIIFKYIDKHFPPRKIRLRDHNKTWITRGIKISCRKKRSLLLRTRKFKHDKSLKKLFKTYNSTLKKLVFAAKNIHVKNMIQKAKSKTKMIWKIVKENTGKNSTADKSGIKLQVNDETIDDPRVVSNLFNEYFIRAGKVSVIDANHSSQHVNLLQKKYISNAKSIFMSPVDEIELIRIVKLLKNTSSCGPDNINTTLIKRSIEILCIPLCDIFNACICEGVFPAQLKMAKVIPLHKKNSKTEISNYRPISLLNVFSKIFEKAIATRIVNHFEKNNYLCSQQFGFRQNRNTVAAITELVLQVIRSLNQNRNCAGIFCDLSKAFDCMNHKILLDKLQYYGIRGPTLKLLQSYLSDRVQFVEIMDIDESGCIQNINSTNRTIDCGVPQGSVLGPLLFIIFINDLQYNLTHGTAYLYADDTSIVIDNYSLAELRAQIIQTWAELSYWFKSNGLKMNLDKTLYMPFVRHTNSMTYDLPLPIVKAKNVKFLGIELDTQLRWSDHINQLRKKLASACYALKKLSKMLNASVLKTVYFAHFESIVRYGLEVWGNSVHLNPVLILQKKAIRYIEKAKPLEHCRPIFVKHGILTVISLYIYLVCIFVHKNKSRFGCKSKKRSYRTRHKFDIKLPESNNYVQYKRSLEYNGIKIYNNLNEDIKQISNINEFSQKLKTFLVTRPYYNLSEYFDKLF